jgi:hypothetical protein
LPEDWNKAEVRKKVTEFKLRGGYFDMGIIFSIHLTSVILAPLPMDIRQ